MSLMITALLCLSVVPVHSLLHCKLSHLHRGCGDRLRENRFHYWHTDKNDVVVRKSKGTLLRLALVSNRYVPLDLSIDDKVSDSFQLVGPDTLLPNTSIATLVGGENLGFLLWSYVLFQGLFTLPGRPAEWVLPIAATLFNDGDKLWYREYRDGFVFLTPVYVDLFRFVLFGVAGYYANQLVIWSLGGDSFWGWSIAACLAIPATFINLFRDKRSTRKESEMISRLEDSFQVFASRYISKGSVSSKQTYESRIIFGFRQFNAECRSPEVVSDRVLKRIIRKWVGYKPVDGIYRYVELSSPNKKAAEALKLSMAKASSLKAKQSVDDIDAALESNSIPIASIEDKDNDAKTDS